MNLKLWWEGMNKPQKVVRYCIDWDKVETFEDFKFIFKTAMPEIRFGEGTNRDKVLKFLKVYEEEV